MYCKLRIDAIRRYENEYNVGWYEYRRVICGGYLGCTVYDRVRRDMLVNEKRDAGLG